MPSSVSSLNRRALLSGSNARRRPDHDRNPTHAALVRLDRPASPAEGPGPLSRDEAFLPSEVWRTGKFPISHMLYMKKVAKGSRSRGVLVIRFPCACSRLAGFEGGEQGFEFPAPEGLVTVRANAQHPTPQHDGRICKTCWRCPTVYFWVRTPSVRLTYSAVWPYVL